MIYKLVHSVENVIGYSLKSLRDEIKNCTIGYFDNTNRFRVISLLDFSVLYEQKFNELLSISFISGEYYLTQNGGIIHLLRLANQALEEFYSMEQNPDVENSIGLLGSDLMITSQSIYEDYELKSKESKLLSQKTHEQIYLWNDLKDLIFLEEERAYFQSNNAGDIIVIELKNKQTAWSLKLDNGSFGKRLLGQTESVLFLQRAVSKPDHINVLAVNKISGEILWETSHSFPYYSYDETTDKLYGLSGKTFERINAKSGERELVSELGVDVQVSSHLTFFESTLLYFSAFLKGNIPVFGAVDVNSGKLLFTQEVEIEGEKSFRKGLDQPTIVGNRLYVRDAMKTLHIFERA